MENAKLESTLSHLTEKVEGVSKNVEHVTSKVDVVVKVLLGDPSDPSKPGHSIRLDRLEQRNKLIAVLLGMLGTVCTGIVISIAVGYFIMG